MEEKKIPNHVAIILDGNGRWAQKRGMPRTSGHAKGAKVLEKVAKYVFEEGIKYLSVFVFSTENFNRSKQEVDFLMNLFLEMFSKNKWKSQNVKVIFSGKKEPLPTAVLLAMDKLQNETKNNEYVLNICINYGGRSEIVDAVKKIVESKIDVDKIDELTIKENLYNDLPDIDLMIRTSGEMRISNFMLYQLSYAELIFTDTYFPDFDKKCLEDILEEYKLRDRRFGKIDYKDKGK